MRYPSSSRLSYRNVLIAAALAAGLGMGSAYAQPREVTAAQPHSDGQIPDGSAEGPARSRVQVHEAMLAPTHPQLWRKRLRG